VKHLDAENVRVLILSAGKIEKELESVFGSIPSGLIPLHGKPVIFRILDKLLREGFKKVSITIGFKKEILEKIISEQYKDQIKLNFITTDFEKPPGNSILTAIKKIQEQQLLVILGDTLVENELSNLIQKNNDFVLMSNNFERPANWCIVTSKDGKLDLIIDKKKDLEKNNEQLSLFNNIGPEPLSNEFNDNTLYLSSKGRKKNIKAFIMDSSIVVGVGNIYASESLFLAGISP